MIYSWGRNNEPQENPGLDQLALGDRRNILPQPAQRPQESKERGEGNIEAGSLRLEV